jgi:CHAD domain-containing protein
VSKPSPRVGGAIERETKLVAPAEFGLPDLNGAVPGATAVVLPEVLLDATYYDTTDLRLARAGITLRHRDGETGPTWTVKLPERGEGPGLARREIRFDAPAGQVPVPAAELVFASTRARPLEPVARLRTVRRPVELRDGDGVLLAEVVDDSVSVSRSMHPRQGFGEVSEFREVEVELHAPGRDGRRVLSSATSYLLEAGCIAEPPVPKLVRALGPTAARPPDLIVLPVAGNATVVDLVRHAIARSVADIVRHDPGVRLGDDAEDVHQLRVSTRRLRSDLRSFAPLLGDDRLAATRAEIGWLGGVVGLVRDNDVLAIRLRAAVDALPPLDARGGAQLLGHLERQGVDARATMLAALRSGRYARLLDVLVGLAAAPPVIEAVGDTAPPPTKVASTIARRQWRRLAAAVDALGTDPADAELHQLRILAKRCRYTAEAVAPVVGPTAVRLAAAVADLQAVLGDLQDTVVAEAWLRDAAVAIPASGVAAGQLIARERLARTELRGRWRAVWRGTSPKKLRHSL